MAPPVPASRKPADPAENKKRRAAQAALAHVKDHMTVGLGTGTTSAIFISLLAPHARSKGWTLRCVATSEASAYLARSGGLTVVGLEDVDSIDLAVDGADQVDAKKNLIKGYGGALTREKVVEYSARKFVVIADDSKFGAHLSKPVPVEFIPFAKAAVSRSLQEMGAKSVRLRLASDNEPYRTDNGLWIFDADFGKISQPAKLEEQMGAIPGVLECGIFSRNVRSVLIGTEKGVKEI